ncbi:MAG: YbjN domain-containing protein [bacterium]
MGKLIDIAQTYLTSDEWHFEKVEGKDLIVCSVKGDNASFKIAIRANEDTERVTVFCTSPNLVPEDKRSIVAEFITRATYGLSFGNIEMDMSDGEVRAKSAVDIEGGVLTPKMVGSLISCSVNLMDKYYPGLMAILFSNITAFDAIQQVEKK